MTMPSPADQPPHDPAPDITARSPRSNVMLSATIEHFGGRSATRHRVRDLSTGGIRIDQAGELRRGASVVISVGAVEAVGATIVWVKADSAGLAFAELIDPERARMRTAIAPRSAIRPAGVQPVAPPPASGARPGGMPPGTGAGAGWISDLRNAYGR